MKSITRFLSPGLNVLSFALLIMCIGIGCEAAPGLADDDGGGGGGGGGDSNFYLIRVAARPCPMFWRA